MEINRNISLTCTGKREGADIVRADEGEAESNQPLIFLGTAARLTVLPLKCVEKAHQYRNVHVTKPNSYHSCVYVCV